MITSITFFSYLFPVMYFLYQYLYNVSCVSFLSDCALSCNGSSFAMIDILYIKHLTVTSSSVAREPRYDIIGDESGSWLQQV